MSRRRSNTSSCRLATPGKPCCFCGLAEDNEIEYGKLYELGSIVTHYYCLLLSSMMQQRGRDDQGILGFLAADIEKELKRGKRLTCFHCKKAGATLGCCNTKCKRVFHLPCGLKAGSLHQFYSEFRSYCINHRPKQLIDGRVLEEMKNAENTLCYICYDNVNYRDILAMLWAPCCKKNAFFHRKCVQQLANSSGYFFKCPLCNNKKEFQEAMLEHGIFIPSQDASWELVPNAYHELLYRHNQCDAETCVCPKGRGHSSSNAKWELVLCRMCGSQGIHRHCGQLKWANSLWECVECRTILDKSPILSRQIREAEVAEGDAENGEQNSKEIDSDSDLSVGQDLNEQTEKNLGSPESENIPTVKVRPGPLSYKMKEVMKVAQSQPMTIDSSSSLEGTNSSTNLTESENGDKKIVDDPNTVIFIDSDDEPEDIEIISEKLNSKVITTNDGKKIEILNKRGIEELTKSGNQTKAESPKSAIPSLEQKDSKPTITSIQTVNSSPNSKNVKLNLRNFNSQNLNPKNGTENASAPEINNQLGPRIISQQISIPRSINSQVLNPGTTLQKFNQSGISQNFKVIPNSRFVDSQVLNQNSLQISNQNFSHISNQNSSQILNQNSSQISNQNSSQISNQNSSQISDQRNVNPQNFGQRTMTPQSFSQRSITSHFVNLKSIVPQTSGQANTSPQVSTLRFTSQISNPRNTNQQVSNPKNTNQQVSNPKNTNQQISNPQITNLGHNLTAVKHFPSPVKQMTNPGKIPSPMKQIPTPPNLSTPPKNVSLGVQNSENRTQGRTVPTNIPQFLPSTKILVKEEESSGIKIASVCSLAPDFFENLETEVQNVENAGTSFSNTFKTEADFNLKRKAEIPGPSQYFEKQSIDMKRAKILDQRIFQVSRDGKEKIEVKFQSEEIKGKKEEIKNNYPSLRRNLVEEAMMKANITQNDISAEISVGNNQPSTSSLHTTVNNYVAMPSSNMTFYMGSGESQEVLKVAGKKAGGCQRDADTSPANFPRHGFSPIDSSSKIGVQAEDQITTKADSQIGNNTLEDSKFSDLCCSNSEGCHELSETSSSCDSAGLIPDNVSLSDVKFRVCGSDIVQVILYDKYRIDIKMDNTGSRSPQDSDSSPLPCPSFPNDFDDSQDSDEEIPRKRVRDFEFEENTLQEFPATSKSTNIAADSPYIGVTTREKAAKIVKENLDPVKPTSEENEPTKLATPPFTNDLRILRLRKNSGKTRTLSGINSCLNCKISIDLKKIWDLVEAKPHLFSKYDESLCKYKSHELKFNTGMCEIKEKWLLVKTQSQDNFYGVSTRSRLLYKSKSMEDLSTAKENGPQNKEENKPRPGNRTNLRRGLKRKCRYSMPFR